MFPGHLSIAVERPNPGIALPSDGYTSLHCGLFGDPLERTDIGEHMTRRSE
jgi:hypothetical protein